MSDYATVFCFSLRVAFLAVEYLGCFGVKQPSSGICTNLAVQRLTLDYFLPRVRYSCRFTATNACALQAASLITLLVKLTNQYRLFTIDASCPVLSITFTLYLRKSLAVRTYNVHHACLSMALEECTAT